MILKDLTGKMRRFVRGRISSLRDGNEHGIPRSCLHLHPPGSHPGSHIEEAPTFPENPKLAVFYSGDGGWARLTTRLSARIHQRGIPVAGIDSMHYFWREKEPASAARDLSDLIAKLTLAWSRPEIVLLVLGYSMGADVLPSIARCLPQDVRGRVSRIVLMSPGHRAHLKFRFIGWLGFPTPDHLGHPLLPDQQALAETIPISCFAGEAEQDSLAHALPFSHEIMCSTRFLPGGHHYAGDYDTLADLVLSEIEGAPR